MRLLRLAPWRRGPLLLRRPVVALALLADRPLAFPDLTGLTLLARDGARDQVEVLDGPVGEGLWLPHEHAELQGIAPGPTPGRYCATPPEPLNQPCPTVLDGAAGDARGSGGGAPGFDGSVAVPADGAGRPRHTIP